MILNFIIEDPINLYLQKNFHRLNGQWDAYVDYLKISGNTGTSGSSTKMVALPFDDGPSSTTNQINWTSSAIKNAVGYDVKFFRPPYLATSNSMYENIDLAFIQGVSCNDWEFGVSASQRANTILSSVEDGSIILLHDFRGTLILCRHYLPLLKGCRHRATRL